MSNITKEEGEVNKIPLLVRWAADRYPPIDLNSKVSDVVILINGYCQLKSENEQLKERVKQLTEALMQLINFDADCDLVAAIEDINTESGEELRTIFSNSKAALQNNTLDNDYKKVWDGK